MSTEKKYKVEPDVEVLEGNVKKGSKLFKAKCAQCHTYDKGGANLSGPNLWGLYGRESGQVKGFNYSAANKHSGIMWSDKHMWQYLINPKKYIPGTTMVFAGMKKEKERANMCAFLGSLQD